jgi:hypothetical protein
MEQKVIHSQFTMLVQKSTFVLLLLGVFFANAQLNFSEFGNNVQVVTSGYTIYWSYTSTNITFGLSVQSNGNWFGLGIAEPTSGSMPGADMAIFDVYNGALRLQDYWAAGKIAPSLDMCQSWYMTACAMSNGTAQVKFTRYLNTSDSQDRVVNTASGYLTRMVWAIGNAPLLSYHSNARGPFGMYIGGGSPAAANSSWTTVNYTMPNYNIPATGTTYACYSFTLPSDKSYYVKRYEFINANQVVNAQVHHIVFFSCSNGTTFRTYYENAQANCNLGSDCSEVLYVWAPGQDEFQLPNDVSFLMGVGGAQYGLMQVHYTNPLSVGGESDSSGIRIFYDTVKTTNLAGVMQVGDAYLMAGALAPLQSQIHLELSCPTNCTSKLSSSLTIFGDFLHMHGQGTMMYSVLTKASGAVSILNRIEYYDYGFQQITPISGMQLSAGDRLNTHCVYQTLDRNTSVTFGLATSNEMCIEFLFYYPKVNVPYCTLVGSGSSNMTYCGSYVNVPSPQAIDALSFLTQVFGQTPATCPAGSNNSMPSICGTGSSSGSNGTLNGAQYLLSYSDANLGVSNSLVCKVDAAKTTLNCTFSVNQVAWIALGYSPNLVMSGTNALIAINGVVQWYVNVPNYATPSNGASLPSGMTASISQNSSWTVMTFSQPFTTNTASTSAIVSGTDGLTKLAFAVGSSNTFAQHSFKDTATVNVLTPVSSPPSGGSGSGSSSGSGSGTGSGSGSGTGTSGGSGTSNGTTPNCEYSSTYSDSALGIANQLSCCVDSGKSTLTCSFEVNKVGWIALGWSPSLTMSGTNTMIGISGTVQWYSNIPNHATPSGGVAISGGLSAQMTQNNSWTILKFSQPYITSSTVQGLVSDDSGSMKIAYAVGSSNTFSSHQYRGTGKIQVVTSTATSAPTKKGAVSMTCSLALVMLLSLILSTFIYI